MTTLSNSIAKMRFYFHLLFIIAALLAYPAMAQDRPDNPETPLPQTSSDKPGLRTNLIVHPQSATADNAMIVTANPHASDAALQMLKSGGNAVDAAVAAQLVLGLTEPQSSGLGGGAFVLYYDASDKKLYSFDGRETAPKAANETLFLADGQPLSFWDAVIGGRAVGTPGTPKLIHNLHKRFGAKNWQTLFGPAMTLAENGFEISPRLAALIAANIGKLDRYPATKDYFYNHDGTAKAAGTLLKNPDYARSLALFRDQGEVAFYRGALAHDIVAAVRRVPDNPGQLTLNDLKAYEIKERPNICAPYRGYNICSMGEPSSGALTLLQILGMAERFDLGHKPNATAIHIITEASRLAFADRNFYMADPDFVKTPGALLLSPDYIERRAGKILPNRRMNKAEVTPGIPDGWLVQERSPDNVIKPPGTTHLSIIDQHGNMLSMTSTIEQAFGARLMAGGFLLNNELTDFSFVPSKNGWMVANRVEGGKRPRSSMSPTIIFRPDGSPFMIIGSAGGSRIIGYVAKTIIHVIDWGQSIDQALAAPHVLTRSHSIEMEPGLEAFHAPLKALGHDIKVDAMHSGLTAIHIDDHGMRHGAADPRREGKAIGINAEIERNTPSKPPTQLHEQ